MATRTDPTWTSQTVVDEDAIGYHNAGRAQWKTLRTTNSIERLNEEFRRRVKTRGALPPKAAAVTLLFGLVATGLAATGARTP
jgi:transposase-like protein